MTRAEKAKRTKQDKLIERAYYFTCENIQISVLDIPKVFEVGRASLDAGEDYETMKARVAFYVETIRKN